MIKSIFATISFGIVGTFLAYWFYLIARLSITDFISKKKYKKPINWLGIVFTFIPICTYYIAYFYGIKKLLSEFLYWR